VMVKRKVSVRDGGVLKKVRLRETFPGQTHFPEISPALRIPTIIVLISLAIAVSVVVWWFKS
jgi:hypothetical protein